MLGMAKANFFSPPQLWGGARGGASLASYLSPNPSPLAERGTKT